ncbi:hypothetical protein B3286c1_1036 [Brucella vulpis]|nr:hypothetical protein BF3285c1_1037 [Brucella vulpis]CUW49858.1 hypothetical protein B3286c1_1036 [Brucella vulpis]
MLVWFPAILIVLFFSGAFLGTLIVRAYGRWGSFYVMASVVAILLLVSVLRREGALVIQPVLLLAAAMGAQNAAVQPIGAARLGVTYVTGTLFNAAADLACSLRGETPKWRWLQHVAVWLSLMLGAVGGGLGHSFIGLDALFVPAAMIVGVMVAYVMLN